MRLLGSSVHMAEPPNTRPDSSEAQTPSWCVRPVLALPISSTSDSSSSQIRPSERIRSCGCNTWEVLASPLKQLLITGSVKSGCYQFTARILSGWVTVCFHPDLKDPIACNLFLCKDPHYNTHPQYQPAWLFSFVWASTNSIKAKVWSTRFKNVPQNGPFWFL